MFARQERADYARQIRRHGLGASVWRAVAAAKITFRAWGWITRYATITSGRAKAKVGQLLTLLVRGTAPRNRRSWRGKPLSTGSAPTGRIKPHPAKPVTRTGELARQVQRRCAATISAWDQQVRA